MSKNEKNINKMGIAKFWGWQARGVSMGAMTIIFGFLSIYCTTALKMPAALVGTLMLISKLTDGITDLFAGYLIDNTNTKLGKARPYELAIIPLWLCTWLLFSAQDSWSLVTKSIWVFAMYTFVNSVLATLLYANQTAYMVRAFATKDHYVKVSSYGGIVITLGCMVVAIGLPITMGTMATSAAGWSKMIGMYALPLALLGILRFVFVKETVKVDAEGDSKITRKELFSVLKSNKYIYFVAGISLMANIILGMNAATFYFKYIVGDMSKYSVIGMLTIPMLLVMFFFPVMMKRLSVAKIISLGAILGVAGGVLNFFAGANMTLIIIAALLIGLAGLPTSYISGLMILECASYNKWKGHPRMEGTLSSISGFTAKVGQGVGAGLLGILLGAGGFNGSLTVQSDSAMFMIRCLYGLLPAVMYLIIIFIARGYKLDKLLPQIEAENAQMQAEIAKDSAKSIEKAESMATV